jgi:IS4 transposase
MPRTANDTSCQGYRPALLKAINAFVDPSVLAGICLGGWAWTAWMLVLAAILMAWDPATSLTARYDSVRLILRQLYPKKRLGSTYQGFIKALREASWALLLDLSAHLRARMEQVAGSHWTRYGWCAFAVDGSRVECPRTQANEKALGRAGRNKTGPQLFLTTVYHMGTGLPWSFHVGRGTDSERNHLRQMLTPLPQAAILVADAGFVGYDLLSCIITSGRHFLVRVGSNVRLLQKLGFARLERDNTVCLWPDAQRKKQQPPLILRLIVLNDGRKPVFLLTDVLEEAVLTDRQAGDLYRMRWGIEVFYRSLKHTLSHRKMRSAAPDQARCELNWAVMGLWLLSLMAVHQLILAGKDPLDLSVASALRIVRQAVRHPPHSRPAQSVLCQMARAVKDTYRHKAAKKARDWPHKKHDRPPGAPKILIATKEQVSQAQVLHDKNNAA